VSWYSSRLWSTVAAELADQLGPRFPSIEFDRKGGLVVATTEAGATPLLEFAASQLVAGVDAQPIGLDDALRLEPDLNPAITAAVYYPEDAQVQPVIATEALLAPARLTGRVSVILNAPVLGGIRDASDTLVGVSIPGRGLRADAVVIAAGPWSGQVSAALGVDLPVRPRRGVVLVTTRMRHRIFHKVYDADYVGAVESNDSDLQTSSVVESTEAGTVLIGSSRQQIGFESGLQVEVLRELATKALRLFPFLAIASIMRSYGGFRPFMPDHLPVIGADPRLPGLWHATGHEGAGIGLSLATGDMLAALLTGGEPAINAEPFSPGRQSLATHFEQAS